MRFESEGCKWQWQRDTINLPDNTSPLQTDEAEDRRITITKLTSGDLWLCPVELELWYRLSADFYSLFTKLCHAELGSEDFGGRIKLFDAL